MNTWKNVVLLHADHGITEEQLAHVTSELTGKSGFFVQQIDLPDGLGTVPCGLHGPAMGDAPVPRDEVEMIDRNGRGWADPICDRDYRQVSYVQVIGIADQDEGELKLFTVYGGPLAPQNPDDPSNQEPGEARTWWSEHALSRPMPQ